MYLNISQYLAFYLPYFARWHLEMHFFNENVWISIKMSLNFVPKGPINNIPALVRIITCQTTSHCLNQRSLVYRRIYASLGLNELSLNNIFPSVHH